MGPPRVCLPPRETHKKTLVLDLDETLVHCTVDPIHSPDVIFPVDYNGTIYQVFESLFLFLPMYSINLHDPGSCQKEASFGSFLGSCGGTV